MLAATRGARKCAKFVLVNAEYFDGVMCRKSLSLDFTALYTFNFLHCRVVLCIIDIENIVKFLSFRRRFLCVSGVVWSDWPAHFWSYRSVASTWLVYIPCLSINLVICLVSQWTTQQLQTYINQSVFCRQLYQHPPGVDHHAAPACCRLDHHFAVTNWQESPSGTYWGTDYGG